MDTPDEVNGYDNDDHRRTAGPPTKEAWGDGELTPSPRPDALGGLMPAPGEGGDKSVSAPAPMRRPNRAAACVAGVVVGLAVLGLVSTAFAVKLYLQHRAAVHTLQQSVQSMSLLAAQLRAPEGVQGRLGWLSKAVQRGDWSQAQRAAEALRSEPVAPLSPTSGLDALASSSPGGQLPDPMKVEELDPAVRVFFAQNPDAWRAFLSFTQAAIKIRDLGIDVDDLRALRAQILEAARLGRKQQLLQLLDRARTIMQRKTGPQATQAFEDRLRQFARSFAQAQQQRRDVAPAGRLAAEAERAARRGDMGRAVRLIQQAADALQHARRLPGGAPPRMGMPMRPGDRMPQLGFLEFVAGSLNDVMQAERVDLAHVWTQLTTAVGALREKNQDQIREILTEAIQVMDVINLRRTELSRRLQQTQEEMIRDRPPVSSAPRRSPEQLQRQLGERIGEVLAEARGMSEEEFAARRPVLVARLLELLMGGGRGPNLDDPRLSPEQRVRAKMQMIAKPYTELKRRGADTSELDRTLRQVREAIMAHDYARAEELVDGSIPLLEQLLQGSPPVPQPQGTSANPPTNEDTSSPAQGEQTP